jgi:DNA-binding LacI/PurR family transcriptional regulator
MVAGSCNMTGAALKMASEKGLKLWDNFFYADFDNVDSLERTGVQVTTAIQDYYTMGIELVKSLKALSETPIRKFIPYRIEGLFSA